MDLVLGNIFVRPMTFPHKGYVVEGHCHNFPHVTYVPRGALRFEQLAPPTITIGEDGKEILTFGPVLKTIDKKATDGNNFVLIRADMWHRITALEENSLGHCVYAHRNPQGEVVQEYDGWMDSYV